MFIVYPKKYNKIKKSTGLPISLKGAAMNNFD